MLTDAIVRREKPGLKPRKLYDAHGLYLLIAPNGVRGWRWKYHINGREKALSFGPYPLVSLERARRDRDRARLALRDGDDPSTLRKRVKAAERGDTFAHIARRWFKRRHRHSSPATIKKVRWFLDKCLLPKIGQRPIASLEPLDILEAVKAKDTAGKHETAHRARQMCGQIFRFAVASGINTRDMAADVRDAISPVKVRHHSALTDPADVGNLLRAIDSLPTDTAVGSAMRLAPLLFARPGELRTMTWKELDLKGRVWAIPGEKMKLRREHLVPLSTQAVTLLKARKAIAGKGPLVFRSLRSNQRPLSDAAFNAALRQIGYDKAQMTAHGFRAMARTLLDEKLRIQPDVIEVQLAHLVRGALGETYNRAKYLEERTVMMQTWSDYLDTLKAPK